MYLLGGPSIVYIAVLRSRQFSLLAEYIYKVVRTD